jgi:hypothetical protein
VIAQISHFDFSDSANGNCIHCATLTMSENASFPGVKKMKRTSHPTFDKIASEIFAGILFCEVVLVAIYWLDVMTSNQFQALHTLFDLDGEGNIPAWFSSAQLMVVALAFWTHALRQPAGLRPSRRFFAMAGCAALYVSMDEAGQVHEQVTALMGRRYVDWLPAYAGSISCWS